MKKNVRFYLAALFLSISAYAQPPQESPQIYQNAGIYYRDKAQTILYTGDYREYYENGTLKLEMQIGNGVPEGTYEIGRAHV